MTPQTLGIEVGQREVTDFALALEVGEMSERVEIAPVTVIPPMKLEQVEAFDAHSRQRGSDRTLDDASRHSARMRNPLCKRLNLRKPLASVTGSEPAPEISDKFLGRAVMVGEVPGGKPGIVIGEHRVDCAPGIDMAVSARDLPHPVQDTADAEISGELEAAR